jgi:hypothetical protein
MVVIDDETVRVSCPRLNGLMLAGTLPTMRLLGPLLTALVSTAVAACGGSEAHDVCRAYVTQDAPPRCDLITQSCEDDCDPEDDCIRQIAGTGCADELRRWVDCINASDLVCEEFTDHTVDYEPICPEEGNAVRACLD